MKPLEYHRPETVDEALALLDGKAGRAAPLAGGTDLIVQNRSGRIELSDMVDIKHIPALQVLDYEPGSGLRLGAAVSCAELSEFAPLAEHYPGLLEGAELIGSVQIQSRCSVGGNVCNGSPAADTICALIVLGATCVVRGKGGEREIAANDFMTAPGETALQPGELLVEIRIPPPPANSSSAYLRFIPRNEMDIAVASAAVNITLDGSGNCTAATVAIGAVGPTPLLVAAAGQALVGTSLDEAALQAAGEASSAAAQPIDDIRGTAEYRVHMAGVLTRRAVELAAKRVKENS